LQTTDAKHYKNPSSFTCILNPSITIDFSQVNDDFCDCPDGSDEPGTSACSNLSPLSPPSITTSDPNLNYTVALPGFYCKNKGHRPGYIPFTYINDGVCDYELCCDGSDEWASVGGVKCEDKCREIGVEWRKQNEFRQKSKSAAAKERKELVSQAKRIRLEIEEKIANYQIMLISDEEKIKNANGELVEIEKQEKLRMVRAPKKGGRLGMLASLTKQRITDLKASLSKLVDQHHEAEKKVRQLEEILDKFKEEYNPNFNDEGVKRAVRAWEDYDAAGRYPVGDYLFERELEERLGDDSEHGLLWEDFEKEDPDTSACKKPRFACLLFATNFAQCISFNNISHSP
jgi:protein kinase C substrate 80K-H